MIITGDAHIGEHTGKVHREGTPGGHTGGTQGEHTRDTPGEYTWRVHREGLQSGEGAAAVAVDAEAEGFVEADVTYILGFPEGREGIEH